VTDRAERRVYDFPPGLSRRRLYDFLPLWPGGESYSLLWDRPGGKLHSLLWDRPGGRSFVTDRAERLLYYFPPGLSQRKLYDFLPV
jgi:hypothetical protein